MATAVAAGLCCAVVVVLAAGDVCGPLGDPDPGLVTSLLVAGVRFAADRAGVVTVGSLALRRSSCRREGPGPRGGRLRSCAAGRSCGRGVGGRAVAMVPLSAADAVGQPVGEVLHSRRVRTGPQGLWETHGRARAGC